MFFILLFIKKVVVVLFFAKRIHPIIRLVALVKPSVRFGDFGGGHLDHFAQRGLRADFRKFIYHEETLAWKRRIVNLFADIFSDIFWHRPGLLA